MKKRLIVLSIGGSVITDRTSTEPKIKLENLDIIVSELKKAKQAEDFNLVIVHGMGSFGHPIAKKYSINQPGIDNEKIQGVAILSNSLSRLNMHIVGHLVQNGFPAIKHHSHAITDKGKIIESMPIETISKYIELGMIPVLQAHPVYDKTNGLSILSSDHLAPYLAKNLNADLLITGTSVNGVYDKDPKMPGAKAIKKITPSNLHEVEGKILAPQYADVTGGMMRKINELIDFVKHGKKARLVDVTKPDILSETITGQKEHGTLFING